MTQYTEQDLKKEQIEREKASMSLAEGNFKEKLGRMIEEQEKVRAELKEKVAAQGALAHEVVEESELTELESDEQGKLGEASTSKAPVPKKKKLTLKEKEVKKSPKLGKRKRAKA
jgi:hypothetical protein